MFLKLHKLLFNHSLIQLFISRNFIVYLFEIGPHFKQTNQEILYKIILFIYINNLSM